VLVNSQEFRRCLTDRASQRHVTIPEPAFELLEQYLGLLEKWNQKINLTALQLTPPTNETLDRLFVEPLEAVSWLEDSPAQWFDLGSGGGSPAIPIKVAKPRLNLTMIEARSRKASFLREAARLLNLKETKVESVRYQQLTRDHGVRGSVDLVTARAVRIDEEFVELVASLLRTGGRLVLMSSEARDLTPFFRFTNPPGVFERCST